MNNRNKGILLMLGSALGFSIMAAFVKLSGDVPSIQKSIFRNIVATAISIAFLIYYKEKWFFGKKENQKFLLLRSALGTLGVVLYFYAIDHLVLSDADMLNKLSPFIVILLSVIFLKEKAMKFQIISVIIAFLGTLLIIQPQFSMETLPYLAGLLSAVFSAGAYTVLRVLGNKEKFFVVVFYFSFFSTVVLLPFVIIFYEPMSVQQVVYLLLAGVFATLGQFGITLAYKLAPAKEISIFSYSTVVFAALISTFGFGIAPDLWSIVGYIVIFSSLIYMYVKNNQLEQSSKQSLK